MAKTTEKDLARVIEEHEQSTRRLLAVVCEVRQEQDEAFWSFVARCRAYITEK